MGSYDDLIAVTMMIKGRANRPEDAVAEVNATLRRFLRDDLDGSFSVTVAPVGYEATVTLWPGEPAGPDGLSRLIDAGWDAAVQECGPIEYGMLPEQR